MGGVERRIVTLADDFTSNAAEPSSSVAFRWSLSRTTPSQIGLNLSRDVDAEVGSTRRKERVGNFFRQPLLEIIIYGSSVPSRTGCDASGGSHFFRGTFRALPPSGATLHPITRSDFFLRFSRRFITNKLFCCFRRTKRSGNP